MSFVSNRLNATSYYLVIPYDKKDEIRQTFPRKILWNNEKKIWYTTCNKTYNTLSQYHKHILVVPYIHKDKAKNMGAKWDGTNWYVHKGLYQKCQSDFDGLVDDEPVEIL